MSASSESPVARYVRILKQRGLKDTQPRRHVLDALTHMRGAAGVPEIHEGIDPRGRVNLATVYRIIARFEKLGVVHRHPCNGGYVLCSMPERGEDHGFLHCTSCGRSEEFLLPRITRWIGSAVSGTFRPDHCIAEIHGICQRCS